MRSIGEISYFWTSLISLELFLWAEFDVAIQRGSRPKAYGFSFENMEAGRQIKYKKLF